MVTAFEHFHLCVNKGISDSDWLLHIFQTECICSTNSPEQFSFFHFSVNKVKYLAGTSKYRINLSYESATEEQAQVVSREAKGTFSF